MKTIQIQIREQYGQLVAHPACEQAKIFAAIAKTKTLTRETLQQIQALGYTVQETNPLTMKA